MSGCEFEESIKKDDGRSPQQVECDYEQDITYTAQMRGYLSPLTEPLLLGWRRVVNDECNKLCYISPKGRHMCSLVEIEADLMKSSSTLSISQFTLDPEISLHTRSLPKMYRNIKQFMGDISQGLENKPVICFNNVNSTLPPDFQYISSFDRSLHSDVNIPTDREFMVSCNCRDGCVSSNGCPCRQLTKDERRGLVKFGIYSPSDGYQHQRLLYPQLSGIFECNQYCGCGPSCSNRVIQKGISHRLAVFRTEKMQWGVMTLDDIPQGTFVCTYNGLICNDQTGDTRGVMFGDEYLTELDYIDIMEEIKEGYEDAVSLTSAEDADCSPAETEKPIGESFDISDISYSDSINEQTSCSPSTVLSRSSSNSKEPSVQPGANSASNVSSNLSFYCVPDEKYCEVSSESSSSIKMSFRRFYGEENCYVVDSKSHGNIGRFINHSCSPNLFVQNIFVDSHDLRFPWIAFFASRKIPAFSEVFWDYSYIQGSVEGRTLECLCGSRNCRKRLL